MQHKITEIWREERLTIPGARVPYDRRCLLPFHGRPQEELVAHINWRSHMTSTFKRHADPEAFRAGINVPCRVARTVIVVNLISAGVVRENNNERALGSLPSFRVNCRL